MTDVDPGSFRDPSGFIYTENGQLFRQVNECYRQEYDLLVGSGLYEDLAGDGLMLPHEEVHPDSCTGRRYKILRPLQVPFISYPHEWCFSQLKDAALLTLEIQKRALARGMSLKDASAFNVQFVDGKPVFIDTLSFEAYREGTPWVAYRQFCMHFLAPLALMSRCDIRLGQWFRLSVEGLPLDLASRLLPVSTWLSPSLLLHLHMHARSQKRYSGKVVAKPAGGRQVTKFALRALVDSLESGIRALDWKPQGTEWADYYQDTNYSSAALLRKKELVREYLSLTGAECVWDVGANDGTFSRIAGSMGIRTVSFDIDPACVEKNYRITKAEREKNLLPLCQDVANPTPGNGWSSRERMSLHARGPCDTALALALIHHLAISNNVPFAMIAQYFSTLCRWLVIEFVPKEDSQVQRLLATRQDVFQEYTVDNFEDNFRQHFSIVEKNEIEGTCRVLYLMKKFRQ